MLPDAPVVSGAPPEPVVDGCVIGGRISFVTTL